MTDQPYTEADVEPKAMDSPQAACDHYYASHIRGGCRIHVRVCGLCQAIDFDDLSEQAAEIEQAILDALAAAGRLLPEGARADVMLPDGSHTYFSTHCRHGSHQLCESNAITGLTVVSERPVAIGKVPARCKGCASPCVCECHASPGGGYGFMDRLSAQDQGSTDE